MEALVSCRDLVVGYDDKPVSAPLTFQIHQGDYICVVGENGSGKSTLIKTLLKLEKPVSGSFQFSSDLSSREIGYLPQQTQVQRDFPASVWEIVLSGCLSKIHFKPFYSKKEKDMAREAMKKMEIHDLRHKCYRNLSGGQQQRVLLARALCASSRMILLDEPVTGLDPRATQEMYNLISKLNKDGMTVIMISHDLDEAVKYATHILRVGKKECTFGPTESYVNEHHCECGHVHN